MYTAALEIHDPRFRSLVFGNVHLEKLWTGARWAEGPAYFPAGKYLVWSDIPNDRVMRLDETDGSVSTFISPARHHNGHSVDRQGRLVSCEHQGRCVSRIEHDGTLNVLVSAVDGASLDEGRLFATCDVGLFDGFRCDRNGNLWTSAGDGVHCYAPDGTLLGKIKVPEVVANLCFGGRKGNRLYICGTTSLYAMYVNAHGATWPSPK